MKKLLIFINCFIFAFSSFTLTAFAGKNYGTSYDIDAPEYESDIALLVNVDTDTVIYEKNADKVSAPASLTKIVTALVTLSKCSDLSQKIKCAPEAVDSILGTGSSIAGLYGDEVTTLEMLLYCLFLPSANDAAAVLAYHFSDGKVENFVNDMNEYVKSLGCKNTFFVNPHGLDNEAIKGFDGTTQNQTTAYDMYLISKAALKNDTIVKISSKYGKTMPATNKSDERYLYNTNPLLNNYSYYYYEDAVGLKTGTTEKAGACLISSAVKNGYTYIAISMHGSDKYVYDGEQRNTAFLTCRYMLRWAFENIQMKVLADGSRNMGEVKVKYGRGCDYAALVPSETISAVVKKDIGIDDMKIVLSDGFPEEVEAPVKKGQQIGKAELMYGKIKIADLTLVAQQDVKKNYLWAFFSFFKNIITSKLFIGFVIFVAVIIFILFNGTKKKRNAKKRQKNRVEVVKDFSTLKK